MIPPTFHRRPTPHRLDPSLLLLCELGRFYGRPAESFLEMLPGALTAHMLAKECIRAREMLEMALAVHLGYSGDKTLLRRLEIAANPWRGMPRFKPGLEMELSGQEKISYLMEKRRERHGW